MLLTKKRKNKLKNILINISVLIISLLLIFLVLEAFSRIYFGNNLDYEYLDDFWVLKPNQKGTTFPGIYATINSEGYRGSLIDPKKENILFLGDSFVFGDAIEDNETLTYYLSEEFKNKNYEINVVNGGVQGYGIHQMIELYNYKFSKYKPKYVVLSFIEADIFRQTEENDPLYSKKSIIRSLLRHSRFISYLKPRLEVFRENIEGDEEFREEHYDEFLYEDMKKIDSFNKMLKKENITLILYPWIYNKEQIDFYEDVLNYSEKYNLNLLPNYYFLVFENYSGDKKDLFAKDKKHPSGIQNRRISEIMHQDLLNYILY